MNEAHYNQTHGLKLAICSCVYLPSCVARLAINATLVIALVFTVVKVVFGRTLGILLPTVRQNHSHANDTEQKYAEHTDA